jgi:exosortase
MTEHSMSIAVAPHAAVDPTGARPTTGVAPMSRTARWLLALVAVELVILYAPTVRWLFDRWTMSVWHNAHGMLIPFAVAWFAWQELGPMRSARRQGSAWGLAFLVPALAMHVLDTGIHSQILSAASIVVALPGLSLLFLGPERTKAIAFPLAFMAFMLPLPLVLTERIHLILRQIATDLTAFIVPLFGITVYAEDTSLHLREGTLFVGDACSGFSTLYAACAVAALAAYSCNSTLRRVLTLASAVPLAIAANIVRVVLLVLVVRFSGMDVLSTWVHPASGMLTFALALPAILWIGRPDPVADAPRAGGAP